MPEAPDCEGYCALYDAACDGSSRNPFVAIGLGQDFVGSQSDCVEKCRVVPPTPSPGYTWQSAKSSGNTLGCRLYFANAAMVDPAANCDFAGIRPAGPCVGDSSRTECSDFCLVATSACNGHLNVYENFDQCVAVCAATAPGRKGSTETTNTISCRTAHAFNALLVNARDHCPHAGPLGAGVCGAGGNCEAYCALAKVACPDGFASHYLDDDDCADQCANLDGADSGEYSVDSAQEGGNTVQCRGLAVSRALELPEAERAAACAAVFGGKPCRAAP